MPLASYQCDTCLHRIEGMLFRGCPPSAITCPECLGVAARRFRPVGIIRFDDRQNPYVSISAREWEKDQAIKERRKEEDLKRKMRQAKREILSTPGLFSKPRLEAKRRELKEAASGS